MTIDLLIISSSLNSSSKSRILANHAKAAATEFKNTTCEFIDLSDYDLPFCDGEKAYGHVSLPELKSKIESSKAILIAVPVYNYASGSSIKNLIELTGQSWNEKVVGFLCAAGGKSSYMSILGLANSLMLDFRCLIIPRFVYADAECFESDNLSDKSIHKRINELVSDTLRISSALRQTANSQSS